MNETELPEDEQPIRYKGMLFPGKVSLLAWSIAARLQPDKEKSEERLSLAIAAQIGLNHDQPFPTPDRALRKKLADIQSILDN